ncbi:hypothetical protein [Dactylosporangium sp. CA-139066]|uniref:hypothetical protein n=1 Tax=Dactylosporangium sp. CA-139066 TaxID=3239930 RepID=UPI003D94B598
MTHLLALIIGTVGGSYVWRIANRIEDELGQGPLVVVTKEWPTVNCEVGSPYYAMLPDGPVPTNFKYKQPVTYLLASGATIFRDGVLELRLVTRDEIPAYVYKIEVIKFKEDKAAQPAWVAGTPEGGCGGEQYRAFSADLNKNDVYVRDLGIIGNKPGGVDPEAPTGPIGTGFTTAAGDPVHFYLNLEACSGYYEFGVRLQYTYRGDKYVRQIGTPAEPLRIIGTRNDVPYYNWISTYDPPGLRQDPSYSWPFLKGCAEPSLQSSVPPGCDKSSFPPIESASITKFVCSGVWAYVEYEGKVNVHGRQAVLYRAESGRWREVVWGSTSHGSLTKSDVEGAGVNPDEIARAFPDLTLS